jgi:large subunit ribosomal protein L25
MKFVEVDMAKIGMNDIVHIFDICLPKGVELTVDREDTSHNLPVVSIHASKVHQEEETTEKAAAKDEEADKPADAE